MYAYVLFYAKHTHPGKPAQALEDAKLSTEMIEASNVKLLSKSFFRWGMALHVLVCADLCVYFKYIYK